MLNREFCNRCRSKSEIGPVLKGRTIGSSNLNAWFCPKANKGHSFVNDRNIPPAECPYSMEHAVSESVNIDKKSETAWKKSV
jgi:hypothetical protein